MCKNANCKKKLAEYRDQTRKQYEDIDGLEDDIRDKDAFAQTLVKTKNDIQKELVLLKKQNVKLHKENSDLSDKVKQLDEDTDDGISMLRNAHERERKLNREFEDFKNAETKK